VAAAAKATGSVIIGGALALVQPCTSGKDLHAMATIAAVVFSELLGLTTKLDFITESFPHDSRIGKHTFGHAYALF
jgi:hypothetical protein